MDYHQTTLRLPADLVVRLKYQAALERRSMTNLINDLCDLGLKSRENSNESRLEEFRKMVRRVGNENQ